MSFAGLMEGAGAQGRGLALSIPEIWHQGRTAYGGFSAALLHEAARRVEAASPLPPLRSAVVSFIGPAFGAVEADARLLRQGKNASWVAAEARRGGEVVANATFAFMGPVEASELHLNDSAAPADLIPVDEARSFAIHDHMPLFLRHNFEVRFARPRAEDKQPELCWWVRLTDRSGLDPMSEILLIGDALPPGVLPLLRPTTAVSSMTWQVNLLTAAPQTRDGWWLLRSVGDYAEKGCSSQRMAIWNADGEPVATGMQSVALFG